jgi:DNA-binding MarR family transcriptional regulator
MSSARVPSAVGRLRLANLLLRDEMLARVHRAGFPEVSVAHMAVFRFEGADGRRPTEIAERAGLSKQAINDLLGQLERWGYLVREPHPDDGRARVVRLTARGRELDAAVWAAGRAVEAHWREQVGPSDWAAFRRVLDEMAGGAPPADAG